MNRLILQLINEIVRSVDAIEEEDRYIKEKFRDKSNLIDRNVRVDIKGIAKILSAFKYYYEVNAYGELDSARNTEIIIKECPRCSQTKT